MSEWLDLQLSHHMAAVQAPDALWERIERARCRMPDAGSRVEASARPRIGRLGFNAAWPIAAVLAMMAGAGTLWLVDKGLLGQGKDQASDLRQLAIEQVRNAEPVELHSSDPAQISAWMRRAGLDVKLPSETAATVRLVGARVIEKRGARSGEVRYIGEIRYKVGPDTATLLVARAGSGPDGGHRNLAWRSQGQLYAVASSNSERPDAACLLCHASL
jgi:hypothetical protein